MAALIGVNFNSCKKDDFSEKDAMNLQAQLDKQKTLDQDTLSTKNYRVSYTVTLVDASTSTLKSASVVSAITGAKVKFVQDTTIITKTADASGIVAFSNLKPGMANVNVTLTDYSEVNYTVNLSSSNPNGGRQLSNIIPLIPIAGASTGIIKGKVIFEADLTNRAPEVVPVGTKIIATVDVLSAAFNVSPANITSISYDKLSLNATTDATGNFSMVVPATLLGLTYVIKVSDFTADQKLLQDTYNNKDTSGYVVSIPTNFGSSFTSASPLTFGSPVFVTIGAPDYTYTQATATAEISNSFGLSYAQDTHLGNYYAPNQSYSVIVKNPAIGGTDGIVPVNVSSDGHVTAGNIWAPGAKFPANFDGTAFTLPYIKTPARAFISAVNASGAITSYRVNPAKTGEFYSVSNLQFVKQTGVGIGIVTILPNTNNSGSLYFSTANVNLSTPVGSGYAVGDSLILSLNTGLSDPYTSKLFLTTGSVTGFNITNEGANYVNNQVDVVISSPVNGITATATASVKNGKISDISINNGGDNYAIAPIVTIINKVEKIQAKYYVASGDLSNGQITDFTSINQGNGYSTVPAVTVTSAIPGIGTGASAYAIVSGNKVTSVILINGGKGFTGNTPAVSKPFSITGSSLIGVKSGSTSIIDINLGTGLRSIEK